MGTITTQKADNLLRLLEKAKGCDRPLGWLRPGVTHMKLWTLVLWIVISGGSLIGICTNSAHAGALYI